jgi:hypothetical protein
MLEKAACRAWNYLSQHLVVARSKKTSCLCFVDEGVAKQGGTALTLWALAAKIERSLVRSNDDIQSLEGLAWYLSSQQREDGSFVSKVDILTGQEIPFESWYYPGQAVLALCSAFRILRRSSFLEGAIRGANYLMATRLTHVNQLHQNDHWQMMALAALDMAPRSSWKLGLRQLSLPVLSTIFDVLNGDPRTLSITTTQMTTRLEGLIAVVEVERRSSEPDQVRMLSDALLRGLSWCYERQVCDRHALNELDPGFRTIG